MSVNRTVIAPAEVFKKHARSDESLHAGFDAVGEILHALAEDFFNQLSSAVVEPRVVFVRCDAAEVARHRADVAVYAPLVVVEDDDETLGLFGGVVQSLETDAAGECGVACDANDVVVSTAHVARDGKTERSTQRGACVTGSVAIVLALGAKEKAVQPFVLPHCVEALAATSENFVNVALMRNIEDELVRRRIEDAMQRNGQFDDAEIRAEVTAYGFRVFFGKHADEFCAHFFSELRQHGFGQGFDVCGGVDFRQDFIGHYKVG